MNLISATIVADSKNSWGQRITTMKLVFPRIVLAEFNTHRALSRNSASSRAIPFKRMLKQVQENPFIPLAWQVDHKGMQGSVYLAEPSHIALKEGQWLRARNLAMDAAKALNANIRSFSAGEAMHDILGTEIPDTGVTKQLCNRLLEPFLYHTVLCTGTEFENFFALRVDPMADIHIKDLAEKMLVVYNESEPVLLKPGEWHIPFGDNMDIQQIGGYTEQLEMEKVKIATARCARLSYETLGDDSKIDYAADIRLHDTLIGSGHMSPAEHCARAMTATEYDAFSTSYIDHEGNYKTEFGTCKNYRGFVQYRAMIPNENRVDSRVIKK